jgi:hypothetical protein
VGVLSIEQVLAEEVRDIHGVTPGPIAEVLQGHPSAQAAQAQRARKDADVRAGGDEGRKDVEDLKAFYRALNTLNRAALCLSGGGIRSATFCLGVIQALAKASERARTGAAAGSGRSTDDAEEDPYRSLLSRFHYLSTVSGGGYIGSWLSAWRKRDDFPTVWRKLTDRPQGPDIEPQEISWLRAYSNYLTPRVGIFSADSWTGVAIYLRNLILNWLVIVPALALVVLGLKVVGTFSVWVARIDSTWALAFLAALIGIALLIVAQAFVTAHRPTRRKMPGAPALADSGNVDQRTFLCRALIPSLVSAILLTSFLSSQIGAQLAGGLSTYAAIGIGAVLGAVIFIAGWLAGWPVNWESGDLGRWAASGLVYGALLGFGAHLFTLLSPYVDTTAGPQLVWVIIIAVVLGVPWVLISQLFGEMIFVGLVSYELNSDADREWLGRAAGWLAATAIIWMLTTFITFAAGHFLINVKSWLGPYIASAGGVAGIIGAVVGRSAQTLAKADEKDSGIKALTLNIVLAIAGPIFAAALIVGISVALDLLLLGDSLVQGLSDRTLSTGYIVLWLLIGMLATFFVAWVSNRNVNINRFSLHALYRNRLVRAYLGASRQRRYPDQFTGFDEDDNLRAYELWPPKPGTNGQNTFGLFHVVNITLNVVQSKRLAWQERKAEAFTVSPRHSGAAYKGFRPSSEYGGGRIDPHGPKQPLGISLGTAMAISGAAASPNMGYHSSPSVTLLLALFNARLGWWLGNPGPEGEKTYRDDGPATAIAPLVEETFGLSTDDRPYVYLSDGGHFENLGLYEMVRRRCRFVVAVDAGCDPDFAFEDLGNAVRKIFIDLGIRITFKDLDKLRNHPTAEQLNEAKDPIPYHALGTIHYRAADGNDCKDGVILYVKPAIHGTDNEGAGVRSYAAAHRTFPHETTGDQWFTEAQFESYRSLGLDIMNTILRQDLDPDTFDTGHLEEIMGELTPTLRAGPSIT